MRCYLTVQFDILNHLLVVLYSKYYDFHLRNTLCFVGLDVEVNFDQNLKAMALSDFATGTLLSLGAVIAFGVHTSFAKVKYVIDSQITMPIYNAYFLFGASLTCFVEYLILQFAISEDDETVEFTYLGIIAALLLLAFEVFILLSIQQIGIGYATGFNVFTASITAPIAQIILGQPIEIWYIMVIGLLILALSVFLMSALRDILKYCGHGQKGQASFKIHD